MTSRTVRALLEDTVARFEHAGIAFGHGTANAVDEAAWIILHALGLPVTDLNAHLEDPVDNASWARARSLASRRIRTRKPAAYLLNEAWLGPYRFYVDERVIVPRSFIAEFLLRGGGPLARLRPRAILDLCTGSGCLAILAAHRFPAAQVDAVDLSEDALAVARINVAAHKLQSRIRLGASDLFSALAGKRYDLILSNPPYVKASSMRRLPEEYRKEPEMALASGRDGLDHTHAILAAAGDHLHKAGRLIVEIGHNRKALERAYPDAPFQWPTTSAGAGYVFVLEREALPRAGARANL